MNWKDYGPSTKSDGEINHLVDEVLLDPNFNLKDLRGFRAARENRQTDMADKNSPFLDSFQTATIEIEVPSGSKEVPPANSLSLDCVIAKHLLSYEPCLRCLKGAPASEKKTRGRFFF